MLSKVMSEVHAKARVARDQEENPIAAKVVRDLRAANDNFKKQKEESELSKTLEGLCNTKRILIPNQNAFHALEKIEERAQNMSSILRALRKHIDVADTLQLDEFTTHPILLVGPPGCGKSYISQDISSAIGLKSYDLAMGTAQEGFFLTGTQKGYANHTPGRIAVRLSESPIANPIFLLDEFEKANWHGVSAERQGMEQPMLQLLERDSAERFTDLCLDVQLDASRVSYIATANSTTPIPRPILSRLEVIEISQPTEAQRLGMIENLFEAAMFDLGIEDRDVKVSKHVMKEIPAHVSPRDIRLKARHALLARLSQDPEARPLLIRSHDVRGIFADKYQGEGLGFMGFIDPRGQRSGVRAERAAPGRRATPRERAAGQPGRPEQGDLLDPPVVFPGGSQ